MSPVTVTPVKFHFVRNDKDWKTATDLPRLRLLFEKSKEESDVSALFGVEKTERPSPSKESPRKRKVADSSPGKSPKKVKSEIAKPAFLRDAFTGMKVYVSAAVPKADKLKRYLIAYDADVLEVCVLLRSDLKFVQSLLTTVFLVVLVLIGILKSEQF